MQGRTRREVVAWRPPLHLPPVYAQCTTFCAANSPQMFMSIYESYLFVITVVFLFIWSRLK